MFSENIKLDYSHLSSFYPTNSIYFSYVSSYESLREFYSFDFRSIEGIEEIKSNANISLTARKKLYDAIAPYNLEQNNSDKVKSNLEAILKEETYTIFTGQQAGLLTGPLYTIYKAMTSILMADHLNQKNCGTFVPVFWIASEDHDLAEVNHVCSPSQTGDIATHTLDIENQGFSIGDIRLNNQIDSLIDQLKTDWNQTEFSDQLYSTVQSHAETFSTSFAHLLSTFFKEYGLLIVEPYLLRDLAIPVNEIAVEKEDEINDHVQRAADKLETLHFNTAIKPTENMNLFYYHNNLRSKIHFDKSSSQYTVVGSDVTFSLDELKKKITAEPEKFSQNVVLRPIVQDTLFPNVMTVCGPGEISYFAQLKGVYSLFGKKMPVIYPRASVTLFEKKYQKIKNRFQFTYEEILNNDLDDKSNNLLNQFEQDQRINQFVNSIENELNSLIKESDSLGKNVTESLKPSIRKIEHEALKIREKYLKKLEESQGISRHQIERLKNGFTPKSKPQERVINAFYYINLYGFELIPEIMINIDITQFAHQVLIYG